MEILTNSGLGILGILLFTLFKSKDFILAREFNLVTFLGENFRGWIWSLLTIVTIAIVIYLEPSTKEIIKTVFSIDLTSSPSGGFFLLGTGINVLLKKPSERAQAARLRTKSTKTLK